MIRKQEIIDVLVDEGMSIIECERATNSKEEFRQAIQGLIEVRICDTPIKNISSEIGIQKVHKII